MSLVVCCFVLILISKVQMNLIHYRSKVGLEDGLYISTANLTEKTCMYAVAHRQCTKAMQAKLESNDDIKIAADTSDVILLLHLIKKVTY
jgi:hypothetical protein